MDIGDKRIGVAMSDPGGILATPLMVLKRRGEPEDIDVINRLVRENQAARVIIGLPLKMDGQVGEQAAKVKAFATQLEESSPVPLIFRDERLSTVTAQHLRWEAAAGKRVRKAPDDDAAAAVILQGYLDETRL
ncbi:MAG: Holliday junction resolvase RuvX [Dehalococcoidales bacterium]